MTSFNSNISLCSFCLDYLSIFKSIVLKSPWITVLGLNLVLVFLLFYEIWCLFLVFMFKIIITFLEKVPIVDINCSLFISSELLWFGVYFSLYYSTYTCFP